jgi:hypothetical protein
MPTAKQKPTPAPVTKQRSPLGQSGLVWQIGCWPVPHVAAQVDWRFPPPPPKPLAQQRSPLGQLVAPLHSKGAPPASAHVPMAVHDVVGPPPPPR